MAFSGINGLKGSKARYKMIADCLRRRIIAGDLRPGDRLPIWDDLEQEFGVSRATLSRALQILRDDGFLRVRGRLGTFVAERLPSDFRYAVVFSPDYFRGFVSQYVRAVDEAIHQLHRVRSLEFVHYDLKANGQNQPRFRELLQDTQARRIGGAIFWGYTGGPLPRITAELGLPLVLVAGAGPGEGPGTESPYPRVRLHWPSFRHRAAAWFRERNIDRVAVIGCGMDRADSCRAVLAEHGLSADPVLSIGVGRTIEAAGRIARLLMRLPAHERPRGLLIADDNVVEPVATALMEEGVRVPEELAVLAYTSWPVPVPVRLRVERLGFDACELVSGAVTLLEQQRAGSEEASPQDMTVEARFEEEILSAVPPDGISAR